MNGWMKLAAALFAAVSLTGCSLLKVAVATGDPLSKEEMNVRTMTRGFYYDMDAPFAFTPEHLAEIEAEMRKICKEKLKLERFELPREEALKFMEEKGEPYKVELINDLPADAHISFYQQGEFTDLCAGPHLDSTGRIKGNAIKLTACNAAYWRATPTVRPSSGFTASPSPRRRSWTHIWSGLRRPSDGTTGSWARSWGSL
jgi:threonyl-tRNA synthetase